jgi:hypothetical protein
METVKVVDYAYPCMMAEKALKDLHNAMLDRKYDDALEAALVAMAEAKLAYNAIREEKERS